MQDIKNIENDEMRHNVKTMTQRLYLRGSHIKHDRFEKCKTKRNNFKSKWDWAQTKVEFYNPVIVQSS